MQIKTASESKTSFGIRAQSTHNSWIFGERSEVYKTMCTAWQMININMDGEWYLRSFFGQKMLVARREPD